MNRAVVGLSALLLSGTTAPVLAIPPPPPDDVRVVKVLDGNTIVVTPYGDSFRIRLACIYAPSLRQGNAGLVAKVALERLLRPGAWVTLSTRSKAVDGVDLAEIIAVGTTVPVNLRAPRIISTLQRLYEHEKAAKEAAEQEDLVSTLDEIA